MSAVPFLKGHGTGNDFVVIADFDGELDLTPRAVVAICDRHKGIGADGILRVVRESNHYFMDYRNADGTLAETCGNGIRLFARFLVEQKLVPAGAFTIKTRAGLIDVMVDPSDTEFTNIAVHMGRPTSVTQTPQVTTETGSWTAVARFIPNPHCVAIVESIDDAGSLQNVPSVAPHEIYPDGANFEFIEERGATHIGMRTHERGVGETLSCGSGACSAADVWAAHQSLQSPWTVQVDVLGGTVYVDSDTEGSLTLRGPATFVASGLISPELVSL